MNTEITKAILQSRESLEAYSALVSQDIQTAIFEKLVDHFQKIATDLSLTFYRGKKSVTSRYFGFGFRSDDWPDFHIGFSFDSKNCCNLLWGFCDNRKIGEENKQKLHDMFAAGFGPGTMTGNWAAYRWFDGYRHWHGEALTKVLHGDFLKDLEEKVRALKKIGDAFTTGRP